MLAAMMVQLPLACAAAHASVEAASARKVLPRAMVGVRFGGDTVHECVS